MLHKNEHRYRFHGFHSCEVTDDKKQADHILSDICLVVWLPNGSDSYTTNISAPYLPENAANTAQHTDREDSENVVAVGQDYIQYCNQSTNPNRTPNKALTF